MGELDGLSRVITGPAIRDLHRMQRKVETANRSAIRAVARATAAKGKQAAPVYKGTPRNVSYGDGNHGPMVPGELRKSIKPNKRVHVNPDGALGLNVGPRGGHVHLYAEAQEERFRYMDAAHSFAAHSCVQVHTAYWDAAIHRAGGL